ncbi:hypothetical protein DUK53_06835 [Listeria sp. SHR_NRA_18]|nr:hypothetical protein EP56_11340 [Listeriaceae bacterium FSL A5-0209]RQW67461.1 hypothetical protein DUK53_06835 [Listeria sp. SHR_NRA_18]
MFDMLLFLLLINVLILIYFLLFLKYKPKKVKTLYTIVVFGVVLAAYGVYIWYSISELFV